MSESSAAAAVPEGDAEGLRPGIGRGRQAETEG